MCFCEYVSEYVSVNVLPQIASNLILDISSSEDISLSEGKFWFSSLHHNIKKPHLL